MKLTTTVHLFQNDRLSICCNCLQFFSPHIQPLVSNGDPFPNPPVHSTPRSLSTPHLNLATPLGPSKTDLTIAGNRISLLEARPFINEAEANPRGRDRGQNSGLEGRVASTSYQPSKWITNVAQKKRYGWIIHVVSSETRDAAKRQLVEIY